jgi:membrane protein implicated in regulation of membrane protease activity
VRVAAWTWAAVGVALLAAGAMYLLWEPLALALVVGGAMYVGGGMLIAVPVVAVGKIVATQQTRRGTSARRGPAKRSC